MTNQIKCSKHGYEGEQTVGYTHNFQQIIDEIKEEFKTLPQWEKDYLTKRRKG